MTTAYARRMFSDTVSYTDQLSGGINNSALSFTLKDGSTFPTGASGNFTVTIDPNTGTEEKIECSSRSGATFTVASGGRGLGGTTAVAHSANAPVVHTICGKDLDEANQVVNNTLGKITTGGDLLYAATATTLARLGIGTANQVLSSSGTVPQWSTLLGLIEAQFTASNQVIQGTGNGTGALVDILTALSNKFTAAGQLIAGTGSATGELLGVGSAGQILTVGGADPSGLQWAAPVVGLTNTATVSNKRITKRVVTVTQSATPAINTDNTDVASITGLAQAITSMTTSLTGTPNDGDTLIVRITDNGTARAITWGASFEASGNVALPTTTAISTRLDVGFSWNTVTSKWRCVGVA